MNRDMEEKGIVLRELSCRTAAELPPPELPDGRTAAIEAVRPPPAVRQLRQGELGGSPAEKGIVLRS